MGRFWVKLPAVPSRSAEQKITLYEATPHHKIRILLTIEFFFDIRF